MRAKKSRESKAEKLWVGARPVTDETVTASKKNANEAAIRAAARGSEAFLTNGRSV